MANAAAVERAAALVEIAKIANCRFDERVANANPIASAHPLSFTALAHWDPTSVRPAGVALA